MRLASLPHALVEWTLIASVALAPALAGAADRTLRVAFPSAETSFDPAFAYDTISGAIVGQANDARFNLPEFNKLFEESQRLADSPERTALFNRMTELVIAYAPWRLTTSLIIDTLAHRWVGNYVPHPMRFMEGFAFVDIDDSIHANAK